MGERFEDGFRQLAAGMLRALERRRDRAQQRAGALVPPEEEGGMDGDRRVEHERWVDVQRAYDRAHDGVHAALVFVEQAAEILRKLRRDARERE